MDIELLHLAGLMVCEGGLGGGGLRVTVGGVAALAWARPHFAQRERRSDPSLLHTETPCHLYHVHCPRCDSVAPGISEANHFLNIDYLFFILFTAGLRLSQDS